MTAASGPVGAGRGTSTPPPLDAARRKYYLAEWESVEARFDREPAEAVRRAESVLSELAREVGSASVTGALMREGRSRPGAEWPTGFGGDAEFGAALAEAGLGIFRFVRRAWAAPGDRSGAGEPGPSIDDLRQRKELCHRVFGQLLAAEHDQVAARAAMAPSSFARDSTRILDQPLSGTGARSARPPARDPRFARWFVLQLVLSLAFGAAVLLLLFWLLGP